MKKILGLIVLLCCTLLALNISCTKMKKVDTAELLTEIQIKLLESRDYNNLNQDAKIYREEYVKIIVDELDKKDLLNKKINADNYLELKHIAWDAEMKTRLFYKELGMPQPRPEDFTLAFMEGVVASEDEVYHLIKSDGKNAHIILYQMVAKRWNWSVNHQLNQANRLLYSQNKLTIQHLIKTQPEFLNAEAIFYGLDYYYQDE